MHECLTCAIDLSGPFASFAVADKEKNVLLAESFVLQNRNNTLFFKAFFSSLADSKIEIAKIDKWIVGTGPGSFTGLRIASAFVSGIIYGTDKIALGIPSAFPISLDVQSTVGEEIGVLFPCSKETLYLCGMVFEDEGWAMNNIPECITKKDLIDSKAYSKLVSLSISGEENNLQQLINNGIPVVSLNRFPIEKMFFDYKNNYTDIKELLYLRPPSITVKV